MNAPADDFPELDPGWLRPLLRRCALAVAAIAIFGAVRLPLETRLTQEHHAGSFGNVQLNLSMRERIGQLGFLAALSGFRSLVADLLWVEAHTDWEKVEYGKMKLLLDAVTTLAPRNVNFWDLSSWHMAYNASVAAMEDRKQPSEWRRKKAQHEYFLLGKDYAERGIANNPDAYVLYQSLGNIFKDKLFDHCAASEAFRHAAACPRAPTYEKRFAAYEMTKCPGHEREAWQMLRKLYDMGPQERLPTLETDLKAMEEKLDLPSDQRIYKTAYDLEARLKAMEEKLPLPAEQRVYKTP